MKKTVFFVSGSLRAAFFVGLLFLFEINAQAGNRLTSQATSSSGNNSTASSATPSQSTTAATIATSQNLQASALAQRAQASLSRSLQALQAQQAAQNAAHNAALSTGLTVPNGLVLGGLVPDSGLASPGVSNPVTTWVNANKPTQTTSNGQTTVTVIQTKQQALLNWQTFNVGTNTTLNFDQSAGGANAAQWVAINKVAANIAPSLIFGSLTAQGQVYVINQNGIIFGGASQVNVGALVASSLPINDNLVSRGLLNDPDDQFLFSQANISAGSQGPTPAFTPQQSAPAPTTGTVAKIDAAGNLSLVPASGHDGNVVAQAGANVTTPTTTNNVGGKVALIGPNVANAGTISTPDGQTILAAGNQVGLFAHNGNDPTLRGLDVFVGAVDASSGNVVNAGLIDSPRADVTLVGKSVNQNGVISSSTSVSLNGRIDLLADYNSKVTTPSGASTPVVEPTSTDGVVTLGQGSVTQILPELASADTVVGSQLALSSLVNIQGASISMAQDSLLWAPSAAVPSDTTKPALDFAGMTLTSGVTLNAGVWLVKPDSSYSFYNTKGQIDLESGATIDVAGSQNVVASIAENIVSAQLLGSELANFPLQQDGALRGQTIEYDLRDIGLNADGTAWIGTDLADVSGYASLVPHTVGELTANGGSVNLSAGQSLNLKTGSSIDVSGGWLNYQGGSVQTTKVISGGQIMDLSQASASRVYEGLYTGFTTTSAKWGVTQTYSNRMLTGAIVESGYIQGGSAGSISTTAPSQALDGNLYGTSVAGVYQRTPSAQLISAYGSANFLPTAYAALAVPGMASLTINFQSQNASVAGYPTYSPTPPRIDFDVQQGANDLVLSSSLIGANGFGNFTLNNKDGSVYIPSSVALAMPAGGSLAINAANIDIEGKISSPGGNLAFTVYDYSPYADGNSPLTGQQLQETPPVDPSRGVFKLGAAASLDVAGLLIDDRSNASAPGSQPLQIAGGSISINSFSIDLAAGSNLDVSGGALVNGSNKVTYGAGGSLSIIAGQDPGLSSLVGGYLNLGANLEGYSGGKGGSLSIQTPLVQIGGVAIDPANTLLLSPDFFDQGGFASFTLSGLGEVAPGQSDPANFVPAVSVAAGTTIAPVVQNWTTSFSGNDVVLTPTSYPLPSQRTPVSLNFNAKGTPGFGGDIKVRGDFVLGANAVISTDPGGSVSVSGNAVKIDGSIITPGGKISISGATNSRGFSSLPDSLVTVDLGANSLLSAAGIFEHTFNSYGYNTGNVLSGGSISVSGNILAETGSVLDVSGATAIVDVPLTQADASIQPFSPVYQATRVDSNGGSIALAGGQELVSAATLRGGAGGPSAQGGSLTVSSQIFDPSQGVVPTTPLDVSMDVTQHAQGYSSSGIGSEVLVNGNMAGHGYFDADSFNGSGLDSLSIAGTVKFIGPVTINANRSLALGDTGVIYADSVVNLNAPYLKLGQAFQGPLNLTQQQVPVFTDSLKQTVAINPLNGAGTINVSAYSLIDVGNLSLQNIGNLNLIASKGDVRGDGTLDVAGNISITAGQIYPTTDTTFTISAYDHGGTAGSVNIASSGVSQLPLSAGGVLNVYASNINQGGVLRAPIGTINLGGGVTSSTPVDPLSGQHFTATQNLNLSSGSVTSVSAVDPVTGKDLTIPYGSILNGVSWIDPAGNDITVTGNGANAVPAKAINISGVNIDDQTGATIDISGGGDLYSYQFVSGTSGTKDILASTTSFAIIPGYSANYAPIDMTVDSSGAHPYQNASLAVGSQVYLGASDGLPAGIYTLLPARYALLPGAYLVTPSTGATAGAATKQPDGSSLVLGYRFNGLDQGQTSPSLLTSFEVASQTVVRSRAEYDNFSGNTFLGQSAAAQGISVRLPMDAGKLVLAATHTMVIQGAVTSQVSAGALGSQIDIASPSDILISGPNTNLSAVSASTLVLDSASLSAFGADSLLIGGYRTSSTAGSVVTTTTNNLTVDNSGAVLAGPDIILTSNKTLTLAPNADIEQSGNLSSAADVLLFGNAGISGSGNGALLRVSSDASAQIVRLGVNGAVGPSLTIGSGAQIVGNSLILDSTSATSLDPTARLSGESVAIDSGQISLVFDGAQPTSGLVISSVALSSLQASAGALSMLSYSSIDFYEDGAGVIGAAKDASGNYQIGSLSLYADEFRGFDGGTVAINAKKVVINNSAGGLSSPLNSIPANGALTVNAQTIQLGGGSGVNTLNVDGFSDVNLNASGGVIIAATKSVAKDSSGNSIQGSASFATAGNLTIATPVISAVTAAYQSITAQGALVINSVIDGSYVVPLSGLGATLKLSGASITENSLIQLSSGNLSIESTGLSGNVTIGGNLHLSGVAQPFNDLIKYTSGGAVNLASDNGSVVLNPGSAISVGANAGGGDAGSLTVSASNGLFTQNGNVLDGHGGVGGQGAEFFLDVSSLSSLDQLESGLSASGFNLSQSIRVRTGDQVLNGTATARTFNLSTDAGSITINGKIDASGITGGDINLYAYGSVILTSGSVLTVAGQNFSNAGNGGSITLAAGSETNGNFSTSAVVDIQAGSTIDLSVSSNTSSSAAAGDFTGTLHLRAPQTAGNTDLQINPVNGTILNASSILIEGYQIFDASSDGLIDNQEGNVFSNGDLFAGNTASILNRIFNPGNAALQGIAVVAPGAEIINTQGDLTLANDWDLSQYRFGPQGAPGVLTLRATGNLIFNGSLSDGFSDSSNLATISDLNTALPVNLQSWSYHLTAGADMSAADSHQVVRTTEIYDSATGLAVPGTARGSLKLGNLVTQNNGNAVSTDGTTDSAIFGLYQVIRTGSGDIDIATAGDVLLQNQFATIYTAGVEAPALANFVVPNLMLNGNQLYGAQYTMAGGNVMIAAQGNIAHVTQDNQNVIVMDSEKELPNNWLYRRGYVNPATGQFGASKFDSIASTSWWIDFSNFFEGVGALGGGNVTLTAGHDVSNVDAVAPTNARVTNKVTINGVVDKLAADQTTVELGGGDVDVQSGNNINGGVYYIERGQGTLHAGNSILTNFTRSPSLGTIHIPAAINDSETWLPTTLFVGKGSFDVSAQNDLLLGPVTNPFLLPQGVDNTYWDKSYFSTYAATDAINITSLAGNVTLRESATLSTANRATPVLLNWLQAVDLLSTNPPSLSSYQPWLNITETNVTPFSSVVTILPPTLRATSFSGDINAVGNLTLSPSPIGEIDLVAARSVNGLQPNGVSNVINGAINTTWNSSTIDLSDANPDAISGPLSPYAWEDVVGTSSTLAASRTTNATITVGGVSVVVNLDLSFIGNLFAESGSTEGSASVLQNKLRLHDSINGQPLHANDADPVHIYAQDGDISGLTLFSGKAIRVVAGNDITDVALYPQNDSASDISLVSAGRDIIAYDANSPLRISAKASGNVPDFGSGVLAGDIQISGPGTLEVLAGRNLDLGVGPNNNDGTGVGISSIGNDRNPALPFAGADIVAFAGIGASAGLDSSKLNFTNASQTGFTDLFLDPSTGGGEAAQYLPQLGAAMGLPASDTEQQIWDAFSQLPPARQDTLALNMFYLVLRDAGVDHTVNGGNYSTGYAAIQALAPGNQWAGNILLTSREIKTTNGGNISLFAPGGQLDVGLNIAGTQAVDQGILTEDGGNISIFTNGSVNVGTSRIFTLNGGDEIIWSTNGDIAAGSSSKTIQSAPPTRVLIDPQSGAVETDLAGLSTGGGIGTLETRGKNPSNVYLVAPNGTIDAGDAGIRSSGNIFLAAQFVNPGGGGISAEGTTAGAPAGPVAPNIAGLTGASNAVGATVGATDQASRQARDQALQEQTDEMPSIITVQVIGYGEDDN